MIVLRSRGILGIGGRDIVCRSQCSGEVGGPIGPGKCPQATADTVT